MNKRILFSIIAPIYLTGCAIHQTIKPVAEIFTGKEICLIESPDVRASFMESYKRALINKGYSVKQLPASASVTDCNVTSTYLATWRWDLALYMAYAEIKVFHQGVLAGEAKYDSQRGGANLGKFIDAETKINELVMKLLPS